MFSPLLGKAVVHAGPQDLRGLMCTLEGSRAGFEALGNDLLPLATCRLATCKAVTPGLAESQRCSSALWGVMTQQFTGSSLSSS